MRPRMCHAYTTYTYTSPVALRRPSLNMTACHGPREAMELSLRKCVLKVKLKARRGSM